MSRGRKGDKIAKAFESIPTTKTPAIPFSEKYGVSLPVLRQAKRFDDPGKEDVHVKNIKGVLMIWREKA